MLTLQDFLVVDTEGRETIKEIAVIDSQGQLIYEAFNTSYSKILPPQGSQKSLGEILTDFADIVQSNVVVFHSAIHDLKVLKLSYQKSQTKPPNFPHLCTFYLSQKYFPDCESYSLEYLSKKLNLKVDGKYFSPPQAHSARYDALFTYQLYRKIQEKYLRQLLAGKSNPFSSSRVDNPFQDHLDLSSIYHQQFDLLKSVIVEVKQDKNHQSRGIVVLGDPGSGKTHLMMRLAKEFLKVNRLLFIRCPNHPESVLYHTYSRILESLMLEVNSTGYSQLEFLLAYSFVKLISQSQILKLTQKDQDIVEYVKYNPLELYENLGMEGTSKKRDYWQHIEKRTRDWWLGEYGIAGYADKIIKGIIKFCSYSDINKKELVARWLAAEELSSEELDLVGLDNWAENMSKEAFSLEAIAVFSRLSLLDEPLIIIFDQLEALGLDYNKKLLANFGEAVKELFTNVPNSLIIFNLFPERWQQFQNFFDGSILERIAQNKVSLSLPYKQQLREIIALKLKRENLLISQVFSLEELAKILAGNSIRQVLNLASSYYRSKAYGVEHHEAIYSEPLPEQFSWEERLQRVEKILTGFQPLLTKIQHFLEPETSKPTPNFSTTNLREYLAKNRTILEQNYSNLQIISDSDDLGKMMAIANALATILPIKVDYLRLGRRKLPENLLIKREEKQIALVFLELDGSTFTQRLKNLNELVLTHTDVFFQGWRDERKPVIKGKVGVEEIGKLNYAPNGEFKILSQRERINIELIYKMITDIQNMDLDVSLEEAVPVVFQELEDSEILAIFRLI